MESWSLVSVIWSAHIIIATKTKKIVWLTKVFRESSVDCPTKLSMTMHPLVKETWDCHCMLFNLTFLMSKMKCRWCKTCWQHVWYFRHRVVWEQLSMPQWQNAREFLFTIWMNSLFCVCEIGKRKPIWNASEWNDGRNKGVGLRSNVPIRPCLTKQLIKELFQKKNIDCEIKTTEHWKLHNSCPAGTFWHGRKLKLMFQIWEWKGCLAQLEAPLTEVELFRGVAVTTTGQASWN